VDSSVSPFVGKMEDRIGLETSRAELGPAWLGVARSMAELGSARLAYSPSCKRRLGTGSRVDLARLASCTFKTNIVLIVYKCEINNHNTTLQVI
jgi:hypothetical protein